MNICLERAHRAITLKPTVPPRSIIVRFLDFKVKQMVLQQAWAQQEVEFQGKNVFLIKTTPRIS